MAAAAKAPREVRTFCAVLHATGRRISEALALTPQQIDLTGRVIVFESLKKRKRGVFRAVPVPPDLLDMLDMVQHPRGTTARVERPHLAARPHDGLAECAGGDTGGGHCGRPPRLRQGRSPERVMISFS